MQQTAQAPVYAFGHTSQEHERLMAQAQLFAPATRRLFEEAGLAPGMRVLDLGSGLGDVAMIARDLVGEDGEVVGLDRSADALQAAGARVADRGWRNVTFHQAEVGPGPDPRLGRFDAVVGRFILMYVADPIETVRTCAASLVDGGVLAFQEIDIDVARSVPAVPTYERAFALIRATLAAVATPSDPGAHLHRWFVGAGLAAPRILSEAPLTTGPEGPLPWHVQAVVSSLRPLMQKYGIASDDDLEVETIAARVAAEAKAREATLIGPMLIGATARVQA